MAQLLGAQAFVTAAEFLRDKLGNWCGAKVTTH
jgi:hypothetical protein